MEDKEYERWILSELEKHGMDKASCPHCGNDDPNLMRENLNFTHGRHDALNYQCYKCTQYFKIGPLSECICGWIKKLAMLY